MKAEQAIQSKVKTMFNVRIVKMTKNCLGRLQWTVLRRNYQKIEMSYRERFWGQCFLILKLVTNSMLRGRLYPLVEGKIMTKMIAFSLCLVESDGLP